ncbi:dTDP-4-dehydrorhamnose 3,5-epimerase family protein [Thermodesulforhabdus norvegica]|uniref:dTDP-4-dehydrorhamnose 3,5-epimerase n=1 Tax=Thermodesulforhabdus norvegica TaxID=39841 RepID=A0A1I4S7X9_9BACT|nr:dTDP-4-dehydrorhamnose 3,5-epimerase family protein [Thermodesulforhabdus norvegica]SFM60607.1 dTDP-4-dehydrorhamnose 3,5-epimerase [Thermodesulforhabdus norvegica]
MTIRNLTGPGIGRPRVQKIPGFYGERLIDGVVLKDITLYADERGFLLEVIRMNDNEMKASNIRQIIASYSYPGVIKGWHLHTKQEDRLVCVKGMVKLVLYDYRHNSPTYRQVNEIFMGERYPRAVFIPPGVFHGVKNIGQEIAVVIGMPSLLYDPDNVDEVRVHPLDNDIIPYNWECRME